MQKFRQAFNYLMDRKGILKVGYANLGEVVALPWAPAGPAFDATYNEKYAFNIDKAKELLAASGLSAAEMSNWKLLVNGTDESAVAISQVVQGSLAKAGINIQLDVLQGRSSSTRCSRGGSMRCSAPSATSRNSRPASPRTASTGQPTTRSSERRIRIPNMSPPSTASTLPPVPAPT